MTSSMPLGLAYKRCRYAFCWILFFTGSRFFLGLGGWRDPGVSMIQLQYTRSTHVCQGPQLSERLFGHLSVLGTTVPLLLDKPVAVSMVVLAVECPYLISVRGSVSVTGQPVQFTSSGQLFLGRRWFGWLGRFEFFLSRPLLPFLCHNPLPVFQVPPLLSFFHFLWIFRHVSNATDVWSERWLISSPLSTNHRSRSRLRGDWKILYPWGVPPSILLLSIQPLT